jgi:hypothetical protein
MNKKIKNNAKSPKFQRKSIYIASLDNKENVNNFNLATSSDFGKLKLDKSILNLTINEASEN